MDVGLGTILPPEWTLLGSDRWGRKETNTCTIGVVKKGKSFKSKEKARDEKLSEIPAHRRDPAPLVSEIYRLSVLEYEGRLTVI